MPSPAFTPENDGAIRFLKEKVLAQGSNAPHLSRIEPSPECEAEAVGRMINLATLAGDAPIYIVHLSNGIGLEYIRQAHQRGQAVFAETCPQYLSLDINKYNSSTGENGAAEHPYDEGLKYIMSPPLRDSYHQNQLWQGVMDGTISTVATDHCAFTMAQKRAGRGWLPILPKWYSGVENVYPCSSLKG